MTDNPYILAIDFDGTIAENAWPGLGQPLPDAVRCIRWLKEKHNCHIIIWTCRAGDHIDLIKEWCHKYGLPYDQINEQHPKITASFKNDTRKLLVDCCVDDKNLGGLSSSWITTYNCITLHLKRITKKVLDLCTEMNN